MGEFISDDREMLYVVSALVAAVLQPSGTLLPEQAGYTDASASRALRGRAARTELVNNATNATNATTATDATTPATIPLLLFQTFQSYDTISTLPPAYELQGANWTEPGLTHVFFDDCQSLSFLEQTYGERHARAFLSLKPGAIRSDFIRIAYVAAKGGWYADNKYCPGFNISLAELGRDAAAEGKDLVVTQGYSAELHNSFFGAVPGQVCDNFDSLTECEPFLDLSLKRSEPP